MTVTVNGIEIESDNPQGIARAVARAKRAEKKAEEQRQADYAAAKRLAEAEGYRILCAKVTRDEKMPRGWRLYRPGHKWARNLFVEAKDNPFTTLIFTAGGKIELEMWRRQFLGAVSNGSGFAWLLFVRDGEKILCYAIAVVNGVFALAECPGVQMEDFEQSEE